VQTFNAYSGVFHQGLRFGLTGLSSYLAYIALFFLLSHLFGEYPSLIAAYVTAAALHFFASKYFTFLNATDEKIHVELLRFVVLLCLTTVVNWAAFYCAKTVFHLDVFIALFIGILTSSLLSFSVMRAWVFARK
jgi:putative flippase GtrA